MSVWLVTGGSGFLGRYVLTAVAGRAETIALGRRCPEGWPRTRFIAVDLEDPAAVKEAIFRVRPDVVIHTAGRTPPGEPELLYRANTLASLHLLDALRATGRAARVVLAGSAAELGPVPVEALPVGDDYPCRPIEPYGLSKWLATCAGLAARPPLDVVVGRVFNPVGPGLPISQAFGRFAADLAGGVDRLVVGNLDARRDFVDVRDVARALIALAETGRAGHVYHIGTGRSQSVGDGLAHLIRRCGRSVAVEVDSGRASAAGPNDSRADTRKIEADTGWRAEIPWEQSLDDLWGEAIRRAGLPLTGS